MVTGICVNTLQFQAEIAKKRERKDIVADKVQTNKLVAEHTSIFSWICWFVGILYHFQHKNNIMLLVICVTSVCGLAEVVSYHIQKVGLIDTYFPLQFKTFREMLSIWSSPENVFNWKSLYDAARCSKLPWLLLISTASIVRNLRIICMSTIGS